VLEVVAGVVLAQAAQAVPDAAVGQHHFQAQRQLAGIAVAQHLHAAGIGGQVAADGGAAFGGERQREQAISLARRLLHRMQGASGLDGDGVVGGSTARMRFRRVSAITTSPPVGVAPPHSPVLPPCGTIATPASAQARTTAATSSVLPGKTTQRALPV
jgi:hypothetical protein